MGSGSGDKPRLSVTVLNYNYARYLPACLESILAQTWHDFELIILDDCSSDGSVDVVRRYLDDPRVRLVEHDSNGGFARRLIEGTEECSGGDFLSVISADDIVLRRDAFERQMAALESRDSTVLAFTAANRFTDDPEHVIEQHRLLDHDAVIASTDAFRQYLCVPDFWAPHSGTIVRRSAYERCGGYPRDVTVGLDFALFAAIALEGDFAYIAEPCYGYRVHEGQMSLSADVARSDAREFVRVVDRLCDRAAARGVDVRGLRAQAVRCQLSGLPIQDAFAGRRSLALLRCWMFLRLRPAATLTSRHFWIALMRAAAGGRAFDAVRRVRRRGVHPHSSGAIAPREQQP